MDAVFLKLLNLSAEAGWLVLAVAAARLLLGRTRTPKSVFCLMWALVGLRLVVPLSVESPLSLIPSREVLTLDVVRYAPAPSVHTGLGFVNEAVNPGFAGAFAPRPGDSVSPLRVVIAAAGWVWLAGLVGMVLYFTASALRLKRRVSGAVETEKGVRESEAVPSPFVFGFLRPVIYLPAGLDGENRTYVLAHERAHIRRRDYLVKPLAFLLLSVYWFNPVLWLAYVLLSRDMELACDERVLRELGPEAKRPYAQALLSAVTFHRPVAACPVAFGEGRLKSRVKSVLRWKKPLLPLAVLSLALCLTLGACFLTDPVETRAAGLVGRYKFAGEMPEEFGPNVFGIDLFEDQSFSYFEMIFSSHIGMGRWSYADGIVTLTEQRTHLVGGREVEIGDGVIMVEGGHYEDYEAALRFQVIPEGLVYLAEGSDGFMYVHLQGGEVFQRE